MGLTPVAGSIVAPGIVSLSVNPGKNERKKGSEEQHQKSCIRTNERIKAGKQKCRNKASEGERKTNYPVDCARQERTSLSFLLAFANQ